MRLFFNSLCILALVAAARQSGAQDAAGQRVSLECSNVPVRSILSKLFTGKSSFALSSEIQGSVTIAIKNTGFETVLSYVLKQVDATYALVDNVYVITPEVRPPYGVDRIDPDHRILLQFENVDVQGAIRSLFKSALPERKFTIDSKLKGKIAGAHYSATLEEAVCWLAEQVGGSVKLHEGRYIVSAGKGYVGLH